MNNNNDSQNIEALLHRVSDYRPYTFHRLNRILKENYGCKLENIWQGYKANRRPGYQELYRIVTISDGTTVVDCVTLEKLRHVFANEDYPLYDEYSSVNQTKRNGSHIDEDDWLVPDAEER